MEKDYDVVFEDLEKEQLAGHLKQFYAELLCA